MACVVIYYKIKADFLPFQAFFMYMTSTVHSGNLYCISISFPLLDNRHARRL